MFHCPKRSPDVNLLSELGRNIYGRMAIDLPASARGDEGRVNSDGLHAAGEGYVETVSNTYIS